MASIHDVTGGYKSTIFVAPPAEIYNCGICLEVMRDPKQCPKGHCFCNSCVSSIVSNKGPCPTCRVKLTADNLGDNLFVRNAIKELTVHCSSKLLPAVRGVPKCKWSGPLHALDDHVLVVCSLTPVQCSLVGCKEKICRKNMPAHVLVCPFRNVSCQHCNELVPAHAHQNHTTNCVYRPSVCNLCQAPMQFRLVEAHKRDECGDTLVTCPMFKAVGECKGGCSYGWVKRRLLKSHISAPDVMADNFMYLLNKTVTQKEQHDALKDEVARLRLNATNLEGKYNRLELATSQLQSDNVQLKRANEFSAVKLCVASLKMDGPDRSLRLCLESWLSAINIDSVNGAENIAALHKHLTMEKDEAGKAVFVKHIAYDFPNVTDAIVKSTPAEAARFCLSSPSVKICGEDEAYSALCQTMDKKSVQFSGAISNKQGYDEGVKVLCTIFRFGNGSPEQKLTAFGKAYSIPLESFTTGRYITPVGNVHMLCTFMFDKEKFASPTHYLPPGSKKRKLA